MGIRYDKLPGEWYGPTTAACVLRDISELYAARLSPQPQPQRREKKSVDSRRQPSPQQQPPLPPPLPPPPPPPVIPRPQAAGDVAPGNTDAAAIEGTAAPKDEENGGEPAREDRPRSGAAPREREERKGGGGGGGGGSVGSANGNGWGSDGVVFPSARPLRVFVSQGDVVYIDEVEAVALRGGAPDEETITSSNVNGETTTADTDDAHVPTAEGGSTPGERDAPYFGQTTGRSAGAEEGCLREAGGAASSSSPPAFLDPLLNPGSGGGKDREEAAWTSAVVLLVPLRLGLNELSAGYIPSEPRGGGGAERGVVVQL